MQKCMVLLFLAFLSILQIIYTHLFMFFVAYFEKLFIYILAICIFIKRNFIFFPLNKKLLAML